MKHPDQSWQRLTAAARSARDERAAAAPYGFATRVATLAMTLPAANPFALFDRIARRSLFAAAAFSLAAVAFGYSAWSSERSDDTTATDTVSEILELS
ncbi:MAG: hypothetical protein HYV95_07510 [Opitutae bacterium]|nr:hypothetical protein [Opitutae bacterium]